ncbi:bifunctional diguanylate cyclase/phosphodiesterase [Guptibacillus algicola]|uniref:bifunctional diguanylate cyclase/phosphodiesterase n=1 Tax=Guptibacillus algicola TaxID=225844 RepID=UPI001CD43676|nr:bifunctional diguanylate cyclase/phosphodiesterase [Alkalihalobacillus algicola]MCA0987467.1 EAL domain-containing protein [Alkalihalobacillus algicola]
MGDQFGQYNVWLVSLSFAVAVLAAFTSLQIASRLLGSKGKDRMIWIAMGSLTLGAGIWSMHFVAMLAYDTNMLVTYDPLFMSISILLSITSSAIAFYVISLEINKTSTHLVVSSLIGMGIISMHYIGMAAMQMPATISYDAGLVSLSVCIAFIASFTALKLFLSYAQTDSGKWRVWTSSFIMGVAISGMHYTGMAAASFHGTSVAKPPQLQTSVDQSTLGYLVVGGVLLIMAFSVIMIKYQSRIEDSNHRFHIMDRMHRSIIESANDAVITADHKGKILSWNKAAETIFGYRAKEVIEQPLKTIMPSGFRVAHQNGLERYQKTQEKRVIGQTVELEGLHKSGRTFPIELSLSTINDGERAYFTGIIRDITERIESQKRIEELVYRDDLTHLPNRRMLHDHLSSCIEQAVNHPQTIAVMFLDLDRFKQINDVFGHRVGDELLKEIARRTQSCLAKKDLLARQSGDEFVVVLPHTSEFQVGNVAKEIIKVISEPFLFEKLELYTSTSIGISLYPGDGTTADTLLKHADTAMYEAKKEGGSQYSYFTNEINSVISRKMLLETGLRKAIEREELQVYYQPQVNVTTQKVIGFEALVRWNHPTLGLVSPYEFIPLAEETNLIIPMGEWILRTSCVQFKKWLEEDETLNHISVNISALQFRQPNFAEVVETILSDTNLDASYLELELTESVVQEPERAIPIMLRLKKMGVKLSLDDFGTGYSSLSYLKDFPLDTLKIDKSFTQAIHESSKDKAVVETIVHMALNLGLNVIAEGIETTEQLDHIIESKCHEYQGYLCSPPLPHNHIEEQFIKRGVNSLK